MRNCKMKMKTDKFFRTIVIVVCTLFVIDLIVGGYWILDQILINGEPLIKDHIIETELLLKIVLAINVITYAIPVIVYLYKHKFGKVQDDDETKSH